MAEPRQVSIAGRMMSRRVMGKASFVELQDSKGRVQVYITRDDICPDENKDMYNTVFKRLLDLGDFIGVEGFVFRTQTGEISVLRQEADRTVQEPAPTAHREVQGTAWAYDSFEDPELRYRQRYVDLIVNDGVKDTFLKRAKIISTMRCRAGRSRIYRGGDAHPAIHPRRLPAHAPSSPTTIRWTLTSTCALPPSCT